jgi:predicted dehydrogenase
MKKTVTNFAIIGFGRIGARHAQRIHENPAARLVTALTNDVHVFVIKQNRYNPPIAKVKEILNRGILGPIYMLVISVYWNRGDDYYNDSDWKGKKPWRPLNLLNAATNS